MLNVRFYQTPERGTIHMTITGHADSAPEGEDLVCGAATALAYTLAQALTFLAHQGGILQRKPKIRLGKGKATIIATPTEEGFAQVLQTFWTVQCGFFVLVRNYPKNVTIDVLKA